MVLNRFYDWGFNFTWHQAISLVFRIYTQNQEFTSWSSYEPADFVEDFGEANKAVHVGRASGFLVPP
jgi:hypothetical protein